MMKQLKDKENKVVWVILALLILVFLKDCSISRKINVLQSSVDTLMTLNKNQPSKASVDLMLKINGYDVSYRMLYDNNTVVRTIKRPDDIMNEYILKKEELEKELQKIKY